MIELNLLPDVKLEFIKSQRMLRLVLTIAVIVSAAAIAILLILLSIDGIQRKHLNDLNGDVDSLTKQLQNEPQINKILTVQNQLNSLTALHDTKPAAAQLANYLNDVTPVQVYITELKADFTMQTMSITGTADSLSSVNKYIDTLKFTTYTSDKTNSTNKAFNNVVLKTFGVNAGSQSPNQAVNYEIDLSYDKNIFDVTQQIKLVVPSQVTTRSELDKPNDLFIKSSIPESNTSNTNSQGN